MISLTSYGCVGGRSPLNVPLDEGPQSRISRQFSKIRTLITSVIGLIVLSHTVSDRLITPVIATDQKPCKSLGILVIFGALINDDMVSVGLLNYPIFQKVETCCYV